MRVCFLTHYYPPEVGAPQARISAIARGLAATGVEVTVHTGFPHYPDGEIKAPYRNRPFARERDGDVEVVRTAVYAVPNRGFAKRLANHLSLCASAVAGASLTGPHDVVVVESPPLFTAAAGVVYAAIKRAPLVVNVADQWPASAIELGALTNVRAIAGAEALERWVYRHSAAIAVPTDGLAAAIDAMPSGRDKVERLGPSIDVDIFDPAPARPSGPLRALYVGTIGMAQGLDTLLDAAIVAGPDVVRLKIAGDGHDAAELRQRVASGEAPGVEMVGPVPHAEVPGLYEAADLTVVLLRDRQVFTSVMPTKLIESMAAGRAVALSARGEPAALVNETGAGAVVPPEDPQALAALFRELQADPGRLAGMGTAGRAAAEARFSRSLVVERWRAVLERLAG